MTISLRGPATGVLTSLPREEHHDYAALTAALEIEAMLYKRPFDAPSLCWGRMHEDDARKMYLHQMSGAVITRCGLVIYHREPCLACSPDDIVTLATGEQGLVEYKCSYKAVKESLTLQQAAVQLRGFCSTLSDDGQLQLKRMHTYFYQVQGYLAITGKPLCHFVQWTPKGLSKETIHADPGTCSLEDNPVLQARCPP